MTSLLRPRLFCHRALCALLAGLMLISPAPMLAQQPRDAAPAGAALDASFILPDACAIVACHPSQILNAPFAHLLPTEILQAALIQKTGLDPMAAQQVVLSITPPMAGPPSFCLHSKFSGPVAFKPEALPMPLNEEQLAGKRLLRNAVDPSAPSFYFPDESTIVAANQPAITSLTSASRAEAGTFAKSFTAADRGDDLFAMIDVATLRPLIGMGLSRAPIPPQFAEFAQIPNLVKTLALRVNLSHAAPTELVAIANSEADGAALEGLFTKAKQIMASQQAAQTQQLLASDDPIEQATGRYSQRMAKHWDEQVQIERDGASITLFRIDPAKDGSHQLVYVAVIGVLVALLLPAIQAARMAARRNQSMNNLKNVMLSMHHYHDAHGAFPAHASYGADGKPLLSWRVHILPYLEQNELYQQFHLDEPWDSEHNRGLLAKMPAVFLDPSSGNSPADGMTNFLGVAGEGRLFSRANQGTKMRDVRDGLSNTLAVVQVNDEQAVFWTKPSDFMGAQPPSTTQGELHRGVFNAGFCDGSVQVMTSNLETSLLEAISTIAGGETVNVP